MLTEMQVNTLRELSKKLSSTDIKWLVIGGLAAIAWGAKRPLADIDIQVRRRDMLRVRELYKDSISTDIRHYRTKSWDINQMILSVEGVTVDVCQAEEFFVVKDNIKYAVPVSINNAELLKVEGISVPVIPKDILVDYKKVISRQVDLDDLSVLIK